MSAEKGAPHNPKGWVSREEYTQAMDGGIYTDYAGMLEVYRREIAGGTGFRKKRDYQGLLEKGLEWMMDPLRVLQPHSFSALTDCAGPLSVGVFVIYDPLHDVNRLAPVSFIDCAGKMIQIEPSFEGRTYEGGNDCFGSLLSLPDALAKSWLWRTEGWRIPSEPFQGPLINRGLIGHPSSQWRDADQYLDSLGRGYKKKFLADLASRFPDCLTKSNGIKRYKFRCFLDTRKANQVGPVGDQFFVVSTRTDQVVYHIHHGDVANLRVLHDPADAIDRYCAHVLRNRDGEFDFSPWSELLT